MELGKGIILLATDSNPQTQLFADYLRQHMQCELCVVSPVVSNETTITVERSPQDRVLIMLDMDHLDEAALQAWHAQYHDQPQWILTIFNLKNEEQASQLMKLVLIQGVFYRTDSLELIRKGIERLLDGDFWISRTLMTRMIDFYRRQQMNCYRPACGITQRELEIIGLLGSGASNNQIAERLFVSEYTVKSHLYNIFRKINVTNRMQAVNWARQNLAPPPPLSLQRTQRHSPSH